MFSSFADHVTTAGKGLNCYLPKASENFTIQDGGK